NAGAKSTEDDQQTSPTASVKALPASNTDTYDFSFINALKQRLYSNLQLQVPLPLVNLTQSEAIYYKENVVVSVDGALDIAMATVHQNNTLWRMHRKRRITASRCYELFTYCNNANPNWPRKIDSLINSTFTGNAATDYGNSCESLARQVYQCQYGQVHSTGLLINPSIPWLGFSPDGLKMHSGVIYKLIEIKCPVLGKTSGVEGFISELPYLKYDNQQLFPYCLNTNHKYYGQVQLAMFLLNIELCDFVIFSSFDNSIFVIEVERDDVFLQALITKLHYVYFRYYLKMLSS
ncbi:hypothetical protein PPYR_01537, partial [Photinus pyralis]